MDTDTEMLMAAGEFDDLMTDGPESIELVSASEDPELATALTEQALRDANPRPLMADAPAGQVDLPGGWIDPSGSLHRQALVTELTGRAEEKLSRIDPLANGPLFFRTMLDFGLEEIGGHKPDDAMMASLLVGDREALILGIRIATYGEELPMHIRCPECGVEEDLAVELSKDVPITTMESPEIREHEVTLRKGRVAVVSPLTCADQDAVWDVKKSAAEMKTGYLHRCIRSIDGRPVSYDDVLNLGMGDRKTLLDFLADLQPGPDYEGVRLPCGSCGEEFTLVIRLTDLFQ